MTRKTTRHGQSGLSPGPQWNWLRRDPCTFFQYEAEIKSPDVLERQPWASGAPDCAGASPSGTIPALTRSHRRGVQTSQRRSVCPSSGDPEPRRVQGQPETRSQSLRDPISASSAELRAGALGLITQLGAPGSAPQRDPPEMEELGGGETPIDLEAQALCPPHYWLPGVCGFGIWSISRIQEKNKMRRLRGTRAGIPDPSLLFPPLPRHWAVACGMGPASASGSCNLLTSTTQPPWDLESRGTQGSQGSSKAA